jgi:CDP-diacylglycerol--serine O-phosphatidyltransferase
MYQLINISLAMGALQDTHIGVLIRSLHLSYIAFLIPIFSAIRLAKFNIDTRQTNLFIGVPTPANTILICSIPLILYFNFQFPAVTGEFYLSLIKKSQTSAELGLYNDTTDYIHLILNPYFLIGLTLVMSYMLVAELPLFALKFKNFGWTDNKIRYSFLIISVILLILFQFIAIPFIIFLYIILSVINNSFNKQKQHNKY